MSVIECDYILCLLSIARCLVSPISLNCFFNLSLCLSILSNNSCFWWCLHWQRDTLFLPWDTLLFLCITLLQLLILLLLFLLSSCSNCEGLTPCPESLLKSAGPLRPKTPSDMYRMFRAATLTHRWRRSQFDDDFDATEWKWTLIQDKAKPSKTGGKIRAPFFYFSSCLCLVLQRSLFYIQ